MSSLREIKDRIGSVRSTLKITSAMKLVASAKLRKAQRTIEGLRPYETTLNEILSEMIAGSAICQTVAAEPASHKIAVVAIASNSSLCGGFNSNVIKKVLETIHGYRDEGFEVEVHALGRKMAEAMRKAGYDSPADYSDVIGHPEYTRSTKLADSLVKRFESGELSRIVLIYNHFVSTSKQVVEVEQYLPFENAATAKAPETDSESEFIIEPSPEEVIKTLMPQVLMLKFHSAVLDSAAAEHAARTVAMQTATDNAQDLLGELTLEYNKGRQQKITSEILDLLGGIG